jgi:hypothetical protein
MHAGRRGFGASGSGTSQRMEHMPSPDQAERNQQRKLEFIPAWPLIASVVVLVGLFLLLR